MISIFLSPSAYGAGGLRVLQLPSRKKNSIIRAKLMYRSGNDTVKSILLFNILIYLFSSRNSPNLVTDLSNGYVLSLTSWFCILEMLISIYWKYLHYFERPCSHGMAKKTWRHERIILCICDQQVSFEQIMFRPPNKVFPVRRCLFYQPCFFSCAFKITAHRILCQDPMLPFCYVWSLLTCFIFTYLFISFICRLAVFPNILTIYP